MVGHQLMTQHEFENTTNEDIGIGRSDMLHTFFCKRCGFKIRTNYSTIKAYMEVDCCDLRLILQIHEES